MKYEYLKGSEKDFDGAPEWAVFVVVVNYDRTIAWVSGDDNKYQYKYDPNGQAGEVFSGKFIAFDWKSGIKIIAERRPITDEVDLNECIGQQSQDEFIDDFVTFGKYDRQCKGVVIDVYDVLQAFEVVNPALQHLIKKALCAGLRGHKKREQDLVEILESAKRAIELEGK